MFSRLTSLMEENNPLRQLVGFCLCAFGVFLALCLMTYNHQDPSLNKSTADFVTNAGGYVGALMADLSLQTLGIASLLVVLVPFSWGWKMIIGRDVSYIYLRVTMLLVACVFAATMLELPNAWSSWPVDSGLGGAIGELIYNISPRIIGNPLFLAFLASAALFSSALAFGMDMEEWTAVIAFFKRMGEFVWGGAVALVDRVRGVERAREEDDEDEEDEEDEGEYDEYDDEEDEEYEPWHQRVWAAVSDKLFFWRNRYEEDEEEEDDEEEVEEEEDEEEEERPRKKAAAKKKLPKLAGAQSSLALPKGDYMLPPVSLLSPPAKGKKSGMNESALRQNAQLLETVLQDFGVQGKIIEVKPGPVVTLYELEPSPGTKSSRVIGLADDIARSMSAVSARIAVVPGRNVIGIELPNATRETVYLREMLENACFDNNESKLPLALGKDIGGSPIVVDLARMPHLLVAGTTGSGKSVAINTMILSLAYRLTPDECKFIMIDPKMLELSIYDGIPHLLTPVVTEPGKAVVALKWTVKEMENRYRLMANLSVRNIDGYNKAIREAKAKGKQLTRRVQTGFDTDTGNAIIEEMPLDMAELPYIVVVVDEMADLMIVAGKDIEGSIQRLAQMARAAGIHIIMATQRPSVDVITGVIKANFPTRISFQVTSRIDSRTILGEQGAEQLLGQGDMLYMAGGGRITRIHGPFVADKEVEEVVNHLKAQGEPSYIEDVTRDDEAEGGEFGGEGGERDEMYDQAVAIVARDRKASTSYIQRCLKIGYNRAASIIERMEREGVVGPANHVGKREVLVREEA